MKHMTQTTHQLYSFFNRQSLKPLQERHFGKIYSWSSGHYWKLVMLPVGLADKPAIVLRDNIFLDV